jgi:hypothetical protein
VVRAGTAAAYDPRNVELEAPAMTMGGLWRTLAVALPVLAACIANLSSVDLTYHLRAGQEILAGRAIPTVDSWTFTAAGQPWFDQQWAAQVILELTYRLGGWTGLVLLRALLAGLTFGLVAAACRIRGADDRRAAWLALASFAVASFALALRPQLFGMALFAVTLLLVADRRAHPRGLWLVPVLTVLWANLHGSFIFAPLVMGLVLVEDLVERSPSWRQTLAILVVTCLAPVVNPAGFAVWQYAVGLSLNPSVTEQVTEWQPTVLRTPVGIAFFGSAIAIAALLARRGRPTPWPALAWLGVFFVIGALAVRGVAWWSLAAAVGVAGLVGPEAAAVRRPEPARRGTLLIPAAIGVACIALLPVWRPTDPGLGTPAGVVGNAPPGITAALRDGADPGDHVLNPQPWGSWFEFALPDLPVSLDSRIELFPASVWTTEALIRTGGDGWQTALSDWAVRFVVVGPSEGAFVGRLEGAGWRIVHEDADGKVLERPPAAAGAARSAPPHSNRADSTAQIARVDQ